MSAPTQSLHIVELRATRPETTLFEPPVVKATIRSES